MGAWQVGAGAQDMGASSGLARGAAGYMRLRKESLVCFFTCHGSESGRYSHNFLHFFNLNSTAGNLVKPADPQSVNNKQTELYKSKAFLL